MLYLRNLAVVEVKLMVEQKTPPLERAFGHEESACPAAIFSFLPLDRLGFY
jgi:hypothetical protein